MADLQPEDILLDAKDLPWLPLGEGITYKLLRVSPETGAWSALIRMAPGSSFAPHKHLAAADFYVLRGRLHYRAGTATEGCYGYEPLGMEHGRTHVDEETWFLFNAYGPIAFHDEQGAVTMILDWEYVRDQARGVRTAADFAGLAGAAAGPSLHGA